MTTTRPLLTFEEYLAYDDGTDTRYELVDGELVAMPPESPENNAIAKRLFVELLRHFPMDLVAYKDTGVEVSGRRCRCRIPAGTYPRVCRCLGGGHTGHHYPRHAASSPGD
ncbi:hypothetical protein XM38_045690 [Halomicronema hongdechloris C2206]|uniref:Putative restriction endonuclease domain-containing protein n=1 Tax=Halomicronema hongdechloris C2206 TaxID=1641165 RepID=A0A1Z3HTF4_9CYAN|nr:Uma2 family endonuclease [Halomicronema hongdechloris]ASC73598.1 hypothetical protein XM38_045690 [Halomicronema hongdechloris C2206]